MTISTHKCEVVKLTEAHPIENADRILRVDVFGGYPCVVPKKDWEPGLWIYIPPDSLVDTRRKEFEFLAAPGMGVRQDGYARIKARKFRKQPSMGLLLRAPWDAVEGDDYAAHLGVKHYEPPVKGSSYTAPRSKSEKWLRIIFRRSNLYGESPPKLHVPHYDVDALRRFPRVYEGKQVIVTEKIHGSNVAYAWESRGFLHRIFKPRREQNFRVRSRTVWQLPHMKNWYTNAATENIKAFVQSYPTWVLFGEVFGPGVQGGFDYGLDTPTFIAFDIRMTRSEEYMDYDGFVALCKNFDIPRVPELYRGEFDFEAIIKLAEGKSTIGGSHIREGVVVSLDEPNEHPIVRQLKCVGIGYYEKSE